LVDIEDMANGVKSALVSKTQTPVKGVVAAAMRAKAKTKTPLGAQLERDAEILAKPMPDEATAYKDWLEYMEAKWRLMARQRKERRAREAEEYSDLPRLSSSSLMQAQPPSSKRPCSLGKAPSLGGQSFFGDQRKAIRTNVWEIIQIREDTRHPGRFKLWVLIGSFLHNLSIKVDRQFFVNSMIARPDLEQFASSSLLSSLFTSVTKTERCLPRSRPSKHLYQITMP